MWISNKWFKRLDSLMRDLIWKKVVARISLTTLQYGKDMGDLQYPTLKGIFWLHSFSSWRGGDGKRVKTR